MGFDLLLIIIRVVVNCAIGHPGILVDSHLPDSAARTQFYASANRMWPISNIGTRLGTLGATVGAMS